MSTSKNIAFVHDWLTGIGGDVRVLKALHEMYPTAPIYCLYQNKKFTSEFLPQAHIIPSFSRGFKAVKLYGSTAIESLDLSAYDLVISTGSIFSKGIIVRPKTYHINYCHSPTRQVWDLSHDYRHKIFQHFLRIWDRNVSTRVDKYVANSENVRTRIKKYYQRDAEVVYPPVGSESGIMNYELGSDRNSQFLIPNSFLIVSRLYKHKNIDIAIRAFNKLGWNLIIIGDGPERARLERLAGPTVRLLGSVSDDTCYMIRDSCLAFILPQEEDFGIAPIEAMMHGKPVLALRRGGALEYIQEGINGLFFDDAHEAVLADGVRRMTERSFDSNLIRQSVERFSETNFKNTFRQFLMSNS